MAKEMIAERRFDSSRCRHYVNEITSVLHCHHYACLYTQLADDAGDMFDGHKILYDASEETFYPILRDYFNQQDINKVEDRINIVEQYWAFAGMGKLIISNVTLEGGTAEMPYSHVDAGWIKKWGHREQPVNFIGRGFLAAAFASIFNLPSGSYAVSEEKSIVANNKKSEFSITKKQERTVHHGNR